MYLITLSGSPDYMHVHSVRVCYDIPHIMSYYVIIHEYEDE